jgi:hypothetical protein
MVSVRIAVPTVNLIDPGDATALSNDYHSLIEI